MAEPIDEAPAEPQQAGRQILPAEPQQAGRQILPAEPQQAGRQILAPLPTFDDAWALVHPDLEGDSPMKSDMRAFCTTNSSEEPIALCLLGATGAAPTTLAFATELWRDYRIAVGQFPAQEMDGGYRGVISLRPTLPTARDAKQLTWIAEAIRASYTFRQTLTAKLGVAPSGLSSLRVPERPTTEERPVLRRTTEERPVLRRTTHLRFFVSVGRTTPAAMAEVRWEGGNHEGTSTDLLEWNLRGSLHRDAATVRETWVHETFHLEDAHHNDWSMRVLGPLHAGIVAKCKVGSAPLASVDGCLAPYSPGTTRVRGGTFYAFHGGNNAREYGAELAVRFFNEALGTGKKAPWKCAKPENSQAWSAFVDEFWGGRDPLPACPAP